jgi:hypothetical protein
MTDTPRNGASIARIDWHETASSAPAVKGMTALLNPQPRGEHAKLRDHPQDVSEQVRGMAAPAIWKARGTRGHRADASHYCWLKK